MRNSKDEILGIDAAKTEERIKEILAESQRLNALEKEKERFDLHQLKDGETVEWRYTCDLGKDIDGGYAIGG